MSVTRWSSALSKAPRDGSEFQAWWSGTWQPRARFNPETHAFELWGRTDYDTEGWEAFYWSEVTHWLPQPGPPGVKKAPPPAGTTERVGGF